MWKVKNNETIEVGWLWSGYQMVKRTKKKNINRRGEREWDREKTWSSHKIWRMMWMHGNQPTNQKSDATRGTEYTNGKTEKSRWETEKSMVTFAVAQWWMRQIKPNAFVTIETPKLAQENVILIPPMTSSQSNLFIFWFVSFMAVVDGGGRGTIARYHSQTSRKIVGRMGYRNWLKSNAKVFFSFKKPLIGIFLNNGLMFVFKLSLYFGWTSYIKWHILWGENPQWRLGWH